MSPLSTPIQNVNPSQYNIVRKTKNIWIGKEKNQTVPIHQWNPRELTNKPWMKLTLHEFSKGAGYKVNMPKSTTFLYTSNEYLES